MGFYWVLGRALFPSLILISACQIMCSGPAARELALKLLNLAKANLSATEVAIVSLIAIGGVIFVIGKVFGAYLAVYVTVISPILYDTFNYGPEDRYFSPFWIEVLKNVASFAAMFIYFLNE